jgi:ferritin-like metal-binding protein YciE
MAKTKTLQDLFLDSVKDVYFAEKKIMTALPKMAKAAQNDKLAAAFEKHLAETEGQVDRLEKVFEELGEAPKGKQCPAILAAGEGHMIQQTATASVMAAIESTAARSREHVPHQSH